MASCAINALPPSPPRRNWTWSSPDFADELGELRELDAAALLSRDEFQQFRLRALDELQRFLLSHGVGTEQAIQRAAEECNGFGLFIRSLVGLDRNAAKELFAEFLADGTHTATQIRFINEILDELTSRGVMDPARLYDPPFSDLAPTGPEGLFSEAEVDNICQLLVGIRARAVVAQAA
jgi:type I restriction enzyme R subunit